MKTDPKSYILHLTVEEFIEVLKDNLHTDTPATTSVQGSPTTPSDGPTFSGRILYGVAGIEKFFNVSHKTASEWKKTWLNPAIKQNGRKIITDAEYALWLYDRKHAKA